MKLLNIFVNGGSYKSIDRTLSNLRQNGYLNNKNFNIILFCWNKQLYKKCDEFNLYQNLKIYYTSKSLYNCLNQAHSSSKSHFIYVLHENEDLYIKPELLKEILIRYKGKLISFDYILKSFNGNREKYIYGNFCYKYYSMFSPHISTIIPKNLYQFYFYDNNYEIISDYILFSAFRNKLSYDQIKYFNLPITSFTYGGKSTKLNNLFNIIKEHFIYDIKVKTFNKKPFIIFPFLKFVFLSLYTRVKMKDWEL